MRTVGRIIGVPPWGEAPTGTASSSERPSSERPAWEGASCEGLDGPIGDRTVLGVPLTEWQAHAMAQAGAPLVQDSDDLDAECIVAAPHHFYSARAVYLTLQAGRAAGRDLRCLTDAVGPRPVNALTDEAPGLVYLRPGSGADLAVRAAAAEPITISAEEREIPGFTIGDGPLRVADAWVLPVGHWTQLLWANLLALGPHLWSELAGRGLLGGARLGWAALRAWSVQPEDVAARLVRRGAGARVHRNATVEGVWMGEGARIGAGAVVRGAVLGPGAVVEELAVVEGVVMGAGARVQRQALAKFMVIEAGAAHAGIAQLGVVGAGAQVKSGATLMDMTLGPAVRVQVRGELRPAPHGICGVCVGPRSVIGSGVRIAPGRAVPADLTVLPDPGTVLARVSRPAGATRAVVRNGALEPS